MRNAVIVLSLTVALLVGCIIGTVGSGLVIPPVRAGTNPPKWEYYCFQETDVASMVKTSNKLGAMGFEMTGSAGGVGGKGWGTSRFSYWCFKRRRP